MPTAHSADHEKLFLISSGSLQVNYAHLTHCVKTDGVRKPMRIFYFQRAPLRITDQSLMQRDALNGGCYTKLFPPYKQRINFMKNVLLGSPSI